MEQFVSIVYWFILLYIGVSLIVLFYIMTYKQYILRSMKNQEKQLREWNQFFEENPPVLTQQHIEGLKEPEELINFTMVIQEHLQHPQKEQKVREFISGHEKTWVELGHYFENESLILRAYYATYCEAIDIRQSNDNSEMIQMMKRYALSPSIYCRHNALGALYSFGNVNGVVDTFKLLTKRHSAYNARLVGEGLSQFKGNKRQLVDSLFENFSSFSSDYQVGIVEFFQKEGEHLKYQLIDLLKKPSLNKELVCALMRYYKEYPVQAYRPVILSWMSYEYRYEWEIIAVTASTLGNYPGQDTVDILQQCLQATNWFIRKNAAISLERLNIMSKQIGSVLNQEQMETIDQITYGLASKEML